MKLRKYLLGLPSFLAILFAYTCSADEALSKERSKDVGYSGPFGSITLDKLKDGFDVDPGLEQEVGEFIAQTLFGQGPKSDSKEEESEGKSKRKSSKEKKKKKKKKSKKSKKSESERSSTLSDTHSLKAKYDITGPYTPVPTVEDSVGFKRSKTAKALKSLKQSVKKAQIEEEAPEEDSSQNQEAAIEVLSELGKSFEKGQLTEQELSDFIKGIDLEFDDPAILDEFTKRNSANPPSANSAIPVNDEAAESVFKKIEADEPIGKPFVPNDQGQGGVQSDSCMDAIGSIMYSLFQLALCILFVVIIFQLLASVSCVDWSELFNVCSMNEWAKESMNPQPKPKEPCFFDKIPTACDLISLPCKLFGCKGGGGISICDWLPSGGRVPKKSKETDEECAGFMQSLCQGICTSPSAPNDGGGGRTDGAPAGTTDDEEAMDDDGYLYSARQSRSLTDPNALYMSVRHQRGGHATSPTSASSAVRTQHRSPCDQQPYSGQRKTTYRGQPVIEDYTDDADQVDPEMDYGTGGFTTPYVGADDDGGYEDSASVDAYASATAGIAMHGHVRSPRSSGSGGGGGGRRY